MLELEDPMGTTAASRAGIALGTLAAAGAACIAYGIAIERHWYRLRRETVPALAPGEPPCTILHLSDFHLLAGDTRRQRFLEELAELPTDLVVVTGDILGEPREKDVLVYEEKDELYRLGSTRSRDETRLTGTPRAR